MKFTINALDGEARFVSLGSFTFEGLTEWEEGGGDWDYRVVDDSVVNGMQTYSIRLGGNGFNNISTSGATNLMIVPPNDIIVAISEGHYSIKPSYIDKVYDVGSPEPADFNLGRYEYYYTINTRSSTDQSVKFDEFNLVGVNGWDSSVKHYKITALSQVLFRPSQNCFGVGTRLSFYNSGQSSIRIRADYTILNRFLGPNGEWQLTANNQWAPRKGGILNGTTMFADTPWNYQFGAEAAIKEAYSIEEVADGDLPILPEFNPKSGFYLVDLEYNDEPLIGIVGVKKNAEGIITDASIWACARDFWAAKEAPPYSGPTTDDSEGGEGTFTAHPGTGTLSDIRTQIEAFGAYSANFYGGYNKYVMGQANMVPFHEFTQMLRAPDFLEGITNAFTSPLSSIICCHAIPHELAPATTGSHLIVCNETNMSQTEAPTFNTFSTATSDGFFDTLTLDEFYGSFLDYTGTSVYLHLPYIGVVQLDTTACMKGTIGVMYSCDPMTGDVIAFVNVKDREGSQENRYTFKGNCSYQIPMATITPETVQSALTGVRLGTNIIMGALTGGISGAVAANAAGVFRSSVREGIKEAQQGGPLTLQDYDDIIECAELDARNAASAGARTGALMGGIGGINTIGSSLTTAAMGGSGTVQSNGGAGTTTALPDTRCWVLVTRPVQSNPQYYAAHNGYPADKARLVGDAQGLVATASVEVASIAATDNERAEIAEMLSRGVYVSDPYDASIPIGPEDTTQAQ